MLSLVIGKNSGSVTLRPPISDALAIKMTHRALTPEMHLPEITEVWHKHSQLLSACLLLWKGFRWGN